MMKESKIDEMMLKRIDNLKLSDRLFRLKDAMFSAQRKVSVDRIRLAMESWQETEGEDIEIRRAKLFKKILEQVPIAIYDFDIIVGRETEHLVGAPLFMDQVGDAIPGLWDGTDGLDLSDEEREIVMECSRFFAGKTAPDHVKKVWHSLVGTWAEDITEAKGSDPTPDSGYFPGITCRALWEKILSKGMRGMIAEAQAGIERFQEMKETDINKYYFWQAAIIVCQAMIDYAKRYAKLAISLAEKESDRERKNELYEIAKICEWVPENPARTFHEALQCMNFIIVGRGLEAMYPVLIGRMDQYLRPYFEQDIRAGRLTLERGPNS